MSEDLCFLSAVELRARISCKEVSPVEVMRAVLARAEALQPRLNCFITLCTDEAMGQAEAAERKVMAGEPLGLLHGVPVTVKDIVNTKGVKTTFGAVPYKDNVPDNDAVAVARPWRLRAASRRSRSQPTVAARPEFLLPVMASSD